MARRNAPLVPGSVKESESLSDGLLDNPHAIAGNTWASPDDLIEVYSRILGEKVWLACGQPALAEARRRGLPRGVVYSTKEVAELRELVSSPEDVKIIARAKKTLDGRVEEVKKLRKPASLSPPVDVEW